MVGVKLLKSSLIKFIDINKFLPVLMAQVLLKHL